MLDREEISGNLDIEDINHINRSIFNGKRKKPLKVKNPKQARTIEDDYSEIISVEILSRVKSTKKEAKIHDFYEFQDYEVNGLFLN